VSGPRYVCVHGHFYQPPRENPWLEAIERQDSAWPQHDWNERVTDECYAPNAHARILGESGRISAITNNYARLSFNFGPTLLSWMEHARPRTYEAILEADRQSARRFGGHGSAMAQVYNHMILPLANRRDKVTQVRWGIRDFESRFGRAPEGMWLAETAVDTESLEVLAEHGIRFTVLAPHQCAKVRRPGGAWRDVRGQRVDPRRPYVVELPSGRTIAVFFYDGPISRAVAFEHLLNDGYRFAERLLGGLDARRDEPQLVHVATDGETYGHHHSYGEMALAVALSRIERDPDVTLVNYGELLELHPPTWEAKIVEGSSWSCMHGVERWRSDCGCNSGTDWHQRWRAPLRAALDWLRDELAPRYAEAAGELFGDPWEARDAYVDVVLDRSEASRAAFFEAHAARPLDEAERRRAFELLEMQRHAMLMYTSCGWFFDELSGLETVQVVQYAARAVQLATRLFGDRFEPGFRERLGEAPSNRPEYGDGEGVYEALVAPAMVELPKVGAHFAIASVFEDETRSAGEPVELGGYDGEVIERDVARTGVSRLAIGRLRVRSRITTEAADFGFAVLHFGDHNLLGGIRPFTNAARHMAMHGALTHAFGQADVAEVVRQIERQFDGSTFSLRSLFHDEQARILERLLEERTHGVEETYAQIYDQTAPLMRFLESVGQPSPSVFAAAAEYTLMARLRRELSSGVFLNLGRVSDLIEEAREANVALDPVTLGLALQGTLEDLLEAVEREPEELRTLEHLADVAAFVAESPWKMNLGEAQNGAWTLAQELLPGWRARSDDPNDPDAAARCRALEAVARHLGLEV
jgi:alpha-amylase/alpha-mannosidase (GH57 family)